MKLRVAAIVGVAAVAGIFVWQLASHPRVLLNAKVDFLVLTNTPTGVEAHMVMTNPPAASLTTTWFRYDTNGWRAMPGGIQWARHDSRGLVIAVGVSTTNQPLLFVHQFQERSTGPRRVFEQGREAFGPMIGNSIELFTGRIYFVTNRFEPSGTNTAK